MDNDDDIIWEAPPSRARKHGIYVPFLNRLRERPGEWARLPNPTKHPSSANSIKSGKVAGADKDEFDASAHRREDGQYDIYVRYNVPTGNPEPQPQEHEYREPEEDQESESDNDPFS